jgi:hypothetical protein
MEGMEGFNGLGRWMRAYECLGSDLGKMRLVANGLSRPVNGAIIERPSKVLLVADYPISLFFNRFAEKWAREEFGL